MFEQIQYIRNSFMDTSKPILDLYIQLRPLIFLPFNIWFFFVSLPFRVFFALTSGFFFKNAADQLKEKALELKEAALSKSSQTRKQSIPHDKNRLHGWYVVEKTESKEERLHRRKSISKEDAKPKSLKEDLQAIEQRERAALEEKQRLELELEELTKKFNNDEQALAEFENDKQRFRDLILVEQTKCFDFQQDIIALKNQLKSEHESRINAEEKLDAIKSKSTKSKSRKVKSAEAKKLDAEPIQSVWHATQQKGFTEMVAEAQLEESHHKKFSDVLKEAIQPEIEKSPVESTPEYTVIGGDLSSKHITGVGAPSISSSN